MVDVSTASQNSKALQASLKSKNKYKKRVAAFMAAIAAAVSTSQELSTHNFSRSYRIGYKQPTSPWALWWAQQSLRHPTWSAWEVW